MPKLTPTPTPAIDPEFAALCPSLTDEELRLLRDSILREGCREPILCWDTSGTPILDGHHRFEICNGEGLPFDVKLLKLPDREAAIDWIVDTQLGRRNLAEGQKSYLRGKKYRQKRQPDGRPEVTDKPGHSDQVIVENHKPPHIGSTADEIAKETGVSAKTIRRDAKFAQAVDRLAEKSPELAQAAREGAIPKTAVKTLAEAPKAELKKLAKLKGTELRKAATKATKKPPKPGRQQKDPRVWQDIEQNLGKALNRVDALNKMYPNKPMHKTLLMQVKQCFATLEGWKKSVS